MSAHEMTLDLKIWRQEHKDAQGRYEDYKLSGVSPDMSFLEMLDLLNENLVREGKESVVFDHDCREGICGSCSLMINGQAHGPMEKSTTCQLHMRSFKDHDSIIIEPWRANAFPVLKDLKVDRGAFDQIQSAGGYVSIRTGSAPDGNSTPISQENADLAMDAAQCIGCGACVAACKNSSAMLFVGAKVSQYALLPQGQPERLERAWNMVNKMDEVGFGNCTNEAECEASCPKGISISNIARLNRDYLKAGLLLKKTN
jgi:succinate dehydrogenase / fumarate reductase, iron-sulfur subunit